MCELSLYVPETGVMAKVEVSPGLAAEHVPALLEWANGGGAAFLKRFAGPKWVYPLTEEQIDAEDGTFFSIYCDGDFVGVIERFAGDGPKVRLGRFLIDPDRRGEGIGPTALRRLCREIFQEGGVEAICLNVYLDNAGARRCYEKCGFRVAEVRPEWGNCRKELGRGELEDFPKGFPSGEAVTALP